MQINDPIILLGVILMATGVVIPCLFWFVRNLYKIILRKDFWWMNKVLLILFIIGLIVFIVGLIILIVKATSGG